MSPIAPKVQRKLLNITIERVREFPDGNQIVENTTTEAVVTEIITKCPNAGTITIRRTVDYPDGTQSCSTLRSNEEPRTNNEETKTIVKKTTLHDGSSVKETTTEKELPVLILKCSAKKVTKEVGSSSEHQGSQTTGDSKIAGTNRRNQNNKRPRSTIPPESERATSRSSSRVSYSADSFSGESDQTLEDTDDDYIDGDSEIDDDSGDDEGTEGDHRYEKCNIEIGRNNNQTKTDHKNDDSLSRETKVKMKQKYEQQDDGDARDANIDSYNDHQKFFVDDDFSESEEENTDEDDDYDEGHQENKTRSLIKRNVDRQKWEAYFKELEEFKKKHGHVKVDNESKYLSLKRWMHQQRQLRNILPKSDVDRLLELGFEFKFLDSIWDVKFRELEAFYTQHGHFSVPRSDKEYMALGYWIDRQRYFNKRKRLSPEKKDKLLKLGFDFFEQTPARVGVPVIKWEHQYEKLVKFKKAHGHCNVPRSHTKDKRLAQWVHLQRTRNRRGQLSSDKKELLLELGFQFEIRAIQWDHMYQKLVEFHNKHHHLNVPRKKPYNSLHSWFYTQRKKISENVLCPEKVELILSLGFKPN